MCFYVTVVVSVIISAVCNGVVVVGVVGVVIVVVLFVVVALVFFFVIVLITITRPAACFLCWCSLLLVWLFVAVFPGKQQVW